MRNTIVVGVDGSAISQRAVEFAADEAALRGAELEIGQSEDAQLVVVGSHGKGFIKRLLLGSGSRQVLHNVDLPLVVDDIPH